MTPRQAPAIGLRCQHCGGIALPIDPGWTTREACQMLRLTPRGLRRLARVHAAQLDPPTYRRLTGVRHWRLWSSRDVQTLQAALLRIPVNTERSEGAKRRTAMLVRVKATGS